MAEYIKRDELLEMYSDTRLDNFDVKYAVVRQNILDMPVEDVKPVIRGVWIHDGYDHPHGCDWMHCSVCGKRYIYVPIARTNFCPNCGADMMRGE